ncbi:MAG: CpaF family protein, partial [Microbacteriaceae bacterium]|nr:CpaF family protein [Microbacteriaceae bacterium]
MKLSDRLAQPASEEATLARSTAAAVPVATAAEIPVFDALLTLKSRVGAALFERLGSRLSDPNLAEEDLISYAREVLTEIVDAEKVPLSIEERHRLVRQISDDVLGYGPLQPLLEDP